MKTRIAVGKIPPVFTATLRRKAKLYTLEADAWQNNEANGAGAEKGCRKTKAWSHFSASTGGFSGTQRE